MPHIRRMHQRAIGISSQCIHVGTCVEEIKNGLYIPTKSRHIHRCWLFCCHGLLNSINTIQPLSHRKTEAVLYCDFCASRMPYLPACAAPCMSLTYETKRKWFA